MKGSKSGCAGIPVLSASSNVPHGPSGTNGMQVLPVLEAFDPSI